MDLLAALKRPEGKTLEFKRDLSSPDAALRTVTAFANTAGGTLLVGVEDATRHVRGVREPLDLEERLANLISDRIAPRLVPGLELLPWRDTHVLGVEVHPSPSRPHFIRREGPERGVYVRVGSTNRRADRELIEELRRLARGESYDEQAMPEIDSEAIDFRAASESFAPVRKLRRADLETLRLVARHQGREVPTVGGMLLFGKERGRYFPDAWIQAGRFRGTDRSRIDDHVEIGAHPVRSVEEAIAFIEKHALRGVEVGRVRARERWSLPPSAVREAVINAVAHADYAQRGAPVRVAIFDDRLEVESPGLLPFGLTVDDLRRGVSKLRNRVIGRVFHELGLIERWGSGVQRMMAACREAGLAEPALEEIGTRFRVTLRMTGGEGGGRGGGRDRTVDEVERAVLQALESGDGLSTREIAAAIGRTPRTARSRLIKLIGRGLVREIATGPHDPRKRYYLA